MPLIRQRYARLLLMLIDLLMPTSYADTPPVTYITFITPYAMLAAYYADDTISPSLAAYLVTIPPIYAIALINCRQRPHMYARTPCLRGAR